MAVCGRCWICGDKFVCRELSSCGDCTKNQPLIVLAPAVTLKPGEDPEYGDPVERKICGRCHLHIESGVLCSLVHALRDARWEGTGR